jgi:hypothetical protein
VRFDRALLLRLLAINMADNFLHLRTTALALLSGFMSPRSMTATT